MKEISNRYMKGIPSILCLFKFLPLSKKTSDLPSRGPSHQEVREKCPENSNHGAENKSRGKCPGRILDPAANERSKGLAYPEKQGNETESCGSELAADRITHSSCDNNRDCERGETKYDGRQG